MKLRAINSGRVAFFAALANGLIATLLAVASLLHLPLTKFPTEWELSTVQQIVRQKAQLSAEELARFERSVDRIGGNERSVLTVFHSLRRLAIYGFGTLAVLSFASAYLVRRACIRSQLHATKLATTAGC